MSEVKKTDKRKKPKFLRQDAHKKSKLGKGRKKKQKWKSPKGLQSKIRLNIKGKPKKVRIGWGAKKENKGKINGIEVVRVENLKEMESVEKGKGVIIGKVGKRKKEILINKAKEMKLKILNRYKEKNATS